MKNCANLATLNCASSDVKQINLEGCEKLDTLDCSYNSLLVFKATGLTNLHHLECRHQRVYNKPLARLMNFLDLLLGRGAFSSSVADENDSAILSNVENLKAYDATGQELAVEFDRESGEVMFSGEPAKIGYDYVTGFNGMMMDVEVYPSENQTEESGSLNVLGPSGGGCTSGFEMGALGVLVLLMTLPRKKAAE